MERAAGGNGSTQSLVKESHCLGYDLGRELTIEEWRKDQGIIPYVLYGLLQCGSIPSFCVRQPIPQRIHCFGRKEEENFRRRSGDAWSCR